MDLISADPVGTDQSRGPIRGRTRRAAAPAHWSVIRASVSHLEGVARNHVHFVWESAEKKLSLEDSRTFVSRVLTDTSIESWWVIALGYGADVAGQALIQSVWDEECGRKAWLLTAVVTAENYGKRHVCSTLLQCIADEADRVGVEVWIHVRKKHRLLKLYRRLGFTGSPYGLWVRCPQRPAN